MYVKLEYRRRLLILYGSDNYLLCILHNKCRDGSILALKYSYFF